MRNRFVLLLLLALAGCSGGDDSAAPGAQKGHVWQGKRAMCGRSRLT
jgi:hypothetical protein